LFYNLYFVISNIVSILFVISINSACISHIRVCFFEERYLMICNQVTNTVISE